MNEVSNDNKNFFFHPRCTLHFKEKKEKSSLSCTSIVSHFFFFLDSQSPLIYCPTFDRGQIKFVFPPNSSNFRKQQKFNNNSK